MNKFSIPKFVIFILNRLKNAGYQAYVVGGGVRDTYLMRPVTDWDVATSALPEEIETVFYDIKFFSLKHGTVTLIDLGHHFEVTTFRGEKNNLEEDLRRRDFTLNAMAYNQENGETLDPFSGKKDITRKLIRATSDPGERFQEDPLRLLRAVRLATELEFRIERKTLKTLSNMTHLIKSVAPERIRDELMKILLGPRPSAGFKAMVTTGLLRHFLPELLEGYRKTQNTFHRYTIFKHIMETIEKVEPVPDLRLTALFHDIAKPRVRNKAGGKWQFYGHEREGAIMADEIMGRLEFSKEMTRTVTNLIKHHMIGYNPGWSDSAVRRLIRRVGPENIMALVSFCRADILAHGMDNQGLDLLDELEKRIKNLINDPMMTKTQKLAIDGYKVMEVLGILPGPEVGQILNDLIEKVIDDPGLNNEERLLSMVRQLKN